MTQASEGSQALEEGAWDALPADSEAMAETKTEGDYAATNAKHLEEFHKRGDRVLALKLAVKVDETCDASRIVRMAGEFEKYLAGE